MAQNEKKILSSIVIGSETFGAGMEKELSEVISPDQVKYLTEQGAIEGFTPAKAETKEADAKTDKKKDK